MAKGYFGSPETGEIDFSFSEIPTIYAKAQERAREDAFRQQLAGGLPMKGGVVDWNQAAQIAARAGNMGGVAQMAQLANAQATRAQAGAVLAETIRHHRATENQPAIVGNAETGYYLVDRRTGQPVGGGQPQAQPSPQQTPQPSIFDTAPRGAVSPQGTVGPQSALPPEGPAMAQAEPPMSLTERLLAEQQQPLPPRGPQLAGPPSPPEPPPAAPALPPWAIGAQMPVVRAPPPPAGAAPPARPPGMIIPPRSATGAFTEEAKDIAARQLINGDTSGLANLGRGAQGDARILEVRNRAAQILINQMGMSPEEAATHIGSQIQKFKAESIGQSAEARTGATRRANLEIIIKATEAAIPAALEASKEVGRTRWVPINRLIQAGQVMTSDPKLAKFAMANLQLAEHWARAMNPTGVMRESDRDMALHMLSTSTGPETYEQLVKQLKLQIDREHAAVSGKGQHAPTTEPPAGSAGTPRTRTNVPYTIEK